MDQRRRFFGTRVVCCLGRGHKRKNGDGSVRQKSQHRVVNPLTVAKFSIDFIDAVRTRGWEEYLIGPTGCWVVSENGMSARRRAWSLNLQRSRDLNEGHPSTMVAIDPPFMQRNKKSMC